MKYRIIHGVDLVNVHSMAFKVLEQDQEYFKKLFTSTEISYCQKKKGETNQALSFSARLAAKGAMAKAMGASYTGVGHRVIEFKDIEVINDEFGKPKIKLYNKAKGLALKLGLNQENIDLSISHTDELVIASATALIQERKEVQKMEKEKKTGTVKVIDEAAVEDAKLAVRSIENLFNFLSKETGLILESRRESVNYASNYLVITLREDRAAGLTSGVAPMPGSVIARFTTTQEATSILPPSITIQFYDKYRGRLDGFVAVAKKAAENFGVDIEIRVVKELSG